MVGRRAFVIPGRSEAEGKGIHALRSAPWIPFPAPRAAGDDSLAPFQNM